jgi:hypothetical protein
VTFLGSGKPLPWLNLAQPFPSGYSNIKVEESLCGYTATMSEKPLHVIIIGAGKYNWFIIYMIFVGLKSL